MRVKSNKSLTFLIKTPILFILNKHLFIFFCFCWRLFSCSASLIFSVWLRIEMSVE